MFRTGALLLNGINGENPGDIYSARFLFQPFSNNAPVLNISYAPTVPQSVAEDSTAAMIPGSPVNDFVIGLGWPSATAEQTDADNVSYLANTPPTYAPVGIRQLC